MRGLSNHALQLLQELYESRHGIIGRLLTPLHRRPESILRSLAETCEWLVIPSVVGPLVSDVPAIREATALTIHRLLDHMKPIDILSLAEQFSRLEYRLHDNLWRQFKGDQVSQLLDLLPAEHQPSVIAVLSMHPNGYVREKALEASSRIESARLLPFLLFRQNDWVSPVAQLAQRLVGSRISPAHVKEFRECLALVIHMEQCLRESLADRVRSIIDLVLTQSPIDELTSDLMLTRRSARFEVLKRAFETHAQHRETLLVSGLKSADCVTRLHCFRLFLSLHSSSGHPELSQRLRDFQRDQFMPIRRVAYTVEAELYPDSAVSIWTTALLDRKGSIRELAQVWLRQLGISDITTRYRAALQVDPLARGALEGLADLAEPQDEPLFMDLLNHPVPRYRCIAIRAIVRLQRVDAIPRILPLVDAGHSCLIRAVSRSLSSLGEKLSGQQLFDIVTQAKTTAIPQVAIRIMMVLGKWTSIPWLLKCVSLPDPALSEFAARVIEARLESQRVFIKPTAQERAAIEQELSQWTNPKAIATRQLVVQQLATFV